MPHNLRNNILFSYQPPPGTGGWCQKQGGLVLESPNSWKWGLFRGLDSRKWALFCVFGGIPPLGRNRGSETPEFDVLGSVWAEMGSFRGFWGRFGPFLGV